MINIATDARISPLADIEDSLRGSLIQIGSQSVIDSFVKIKPAGGSGHLIIGEHTVINSGCVLYMENKLCYNLIYNTKAKSMFFIEPKQLKDSWK